MINIDTFEDIEKLNIFPAQKTALLNQLHYFDLTPPFDLPILIAERYEELEEQEIDNVEQIACWLEFYSCYDRLVYLIANYQNLSQLGLLAFQPCG